MRADISTSKSDHALSPRGKRTRPCSTPPRFFSFLSFFSFFSIFLFTTLWYLSSFPRFPWWRFPGGSGGNFIAQETGRQWMVIKDGYLEEVGLTSICLGGWASTDSVRAKVNSERLILFSKGGVCVWTRSEKSNCGVRFRWKVDRMVLWG